MISVVIGIGSNYGNRKVSILNAIEWLEKVLLQTRCSSMYETPCALKVGKPYMNAVLMGYYQGDGFQLDELLKDKEREMGRTAELRKKGDVPIDMDIVIMDGEVVKDWDYRQKFFQIGYNEIANS